MGARASWLRQRKTAEATPPGGKFAPPGLRRTQTRPRGRVLAAHEVQTANATATREEAISARSSFSAAVPAQLCLVQDFIRPPGLRLPGHGPCSSFCGSHGDLQRLRHAPFAVADFGLGPAPADPLRPAVRPAGRLEDTCTRQDVPDLDPCPSPGAAPRAAARLPVDPQTRPGLALRRLRLPADCAGPRGLGFGRQQRAGSVPRVPPFSPRAARHARRLVRRLPGLYRPANGPALPFSFGTGALSGRGFPPPPAAVPDHAGRVVWGAGAPGVGDAVLPGNGLCRGRWRRHAEGVGRKGEDRRGDGGHGAGARRHARAGYRARDRRRCGSAGRGCRLRTAVGGDLRLCFVD